MKTIIENYGGFYLIFRYKNNELVSCLQIARRANLSNKRMYIKRTK